ncbi:MAG: DUF308 domain-containing protein [Anderseniella sp.]|nr:DUF308 domain-containing protein [Anderseniella sp.]
MSISSSSALRWLTAGLLFVAAALALALPFVSATLLTIVIGGVAVAAGISQGLRITGETGWSGRIFRLLSALLYIAGGIGILAFPLASEVSLTLFLGVLLAFQGVMELASAAASQGPARGLVLIDGLVTILLGGLLIAEWPGDSLWAIGTLLGVGLGISAINLLTAPAARASQTDISKAGHGP